MKQSDVSWPRPVTAAASLILALAVLVPWNPPRLELAESWSLVLHFAFQKHLVFGRDLVFTYGPWGFLNTPDYHPSTYAYMLVGRSFLAAAWWWAGWCIARRLAVNAWVSFLWLVCLIFASGIAPFTPGNTIGMDFRCYGMISALLILHFFLDESWKVQSPLVVALALVCLIKSSFLVPVAAVLGVISCDNLRKRRLPIALALFTCAFLGFWVLAQQSPGALRSFFRNTASIVAGFNGAMQLSSDDEVASVAGFVAAAGLAFLFMAFAGARKMGKWVVLPLLAQLAILFVVFKAGYVRHDRHEIIAVTALLLQCVLWLPLWVSSFRKSLVSLAALVPVVFAGILAAHTLQAQPGDGLMASLGRPLMSLAASGGGGSRQQRYEEDMAMIRQRFPLPNLSGTVDCYPWDEHVALAYGFPYSPRPVIESYSAYTPLLAKLNAEHLRGPGAPDFVLFDVRSLDGRFPSMDDGLSWPEILTRYDLKTQTDSFLIFQRSPKPRKYRLSPLLQTEVQFSRPFMLPPTAAAPLWVQLDIRPTLRGKLVSTLYKPSPIFCRILTREGKVLDYRILPEVARSGFLLSPVIDSRLSLARFTSPRWAEELANAHVTAIQLLREEGASSQLEPTVKMSLYHLEFPRE